MSRSPSRNNVIAVWMMPIRNAIRKTAAIRSCSGTKATAPASAMQIALVGPLMSWRDESNRCADGRHHDRSVQSVVDGKLGHDAGVRHCLRHRDRRTVEAANRSSRNDRSE